MPATYTHHQFTRDVYPVLNESVRINIKNDVDTFYLFGKSFDMLFFTNQKLGSYAHNHHVNLYFKSIIQYIRKENLTGHSQVLAYLYGSICHYVLDSTIHPYIYFKTGKYDVKDKNTKKYRGMHDYFEYMIDAILYQERNHQMIYKKNMKKQVFSKITFSSDLLDTIDSAYYHAFGVKQGSKIVLKGYRNYQFAIGHIMSSRFGIKRHLAKLCDLFSIPKSIKASNHSYYIKKLDFSVLNMEHKKWCYPVDKKLCYHYSFYDLYDVAIEKARKLINELDSALLKDDKSVNKVLREIGNLSYSTGKNADKKYVMKYFEY